MGLMIGWYGVGDRVGGVDDGAGLVGLYGWGR